MIFAARDLDSGYDPVWMDLLRAHESVPFHVLVGGGDQIIVTGTFTLLRELDEGVSSFVQADREPELQDWLNLPKAEQRIKQPMTPEMEAAIDRFYFKPLLPYVPKWCVCEGYSINVGICVFLFFFFS